MQLLVLVALIQQDLGICLHRVTGSTATGSLGSHGPVSSVDNWNTRRIFDTSSSTVDEHARSAFLLRFLCEQYHKEISSLPITGLLQFIVKQVPRRSGLYLNHEPNVKILMYDIKTTKQRLLSVNLRQVKTEKLENNLHPCGELADQMGNSLP